MSLGRNRIGKLFSEFVQSEKVGGFILIGCTILSLTLANLAFSESYIDF